MPNSTIRWKTGKGPQNFSRSLTKLEAGVLASIKQAMGEAALVIETTAKRLAPVDTGTLRSSIGHVVNRMGRHAVKAVVGSNVEYAPHQEYGTYKMEAQPFLRPALENNRKRIIRIFEGAYQAAVRAA